MFGKQIVPENPPSLDDKYVSAFRDIVNPETLIATDDNKISTVVSFIRDSLLSPSVLRAFSDKLTLGQKLDLLKKIKKNHSLADNNLNYKTLFLFEGDSHLNWHDKVHKVTDLFPKNKENEWPVLVLTSNSNLVSPQVFFDSFEAAKKLIPQVTGKHENDKIIVMGTYFSKDDALANAHDTLERIHDLKHDQNNIKNLSPAAHIQAGQLLNFLVERDDSGNVKTEGGKPVLRHDADKIMKRVIGYGYSGGHLTNKDSFRTLRDILEEGHLVVKVTNGNITFRPSVKADVQKILPNARLIGIAGADGFNEQERNMPKEVNFVSPEDKILALHGKKFMKCPDVIEIIPPKKNRESMKKYSSDHDQLLYVDAILGGENGNAIKTAKEKLSQASISR